MRMAGKVFLILLGILVLVAAGFGLFWYRNVHGFDRYKAALKRLRAVEKQAVLPQSGSTKERIINYGEIGTQGPALLLIHGQMGSWETYACVCEALARDWHIYAVDLYGHGQSSHDPDLYWLDENGNDLIWFVNNVIQGPTVVAGHSNGALVAAYMAAYGGENIVGAVLEDPPVFSTEGDGWEKSFAYLDTYKPLHDYRQLAEPKECWEAYYLRHCLWGQLFVKNGMEGIANYAQRYHEKHPGEPVRIGFLPYSAWSVFETAGAYDLAYGERFYDLTWNHGHRHADILSAIQIPCVYLHAKETVHPSGTLLCAASREQAERAMKCIGENGRLVETDTGDHMIHDVHRDVYVSAVRSLLNAGKED